MKKILAFVLAMVLCVSFATVAVSVLGAETATETPDTPTFDPSKPYFKVADVEVTEEALAESSQVVVPISVVNNPGIWGFKLQVELGEGLTYVDLEGAASDAMPATSFMPNDEAMLITFDGPSYTENVEGDVVVANLTVQLPADAAVGDTYEIGLVTMDVDSCVSTDETMTPTPVEGMQYVGGSVAVVETPAVSTTAPVTEAPDVTESGDVVTTTAPSDPGTSPITGAVAAPVAAVAMAAAAAFVIAKARKK